MTPEHAKRLLHALADNIAKYEHFNGKIKDLDGADTGPINFGGPKAQA